jgi:hypothetical protein
VFDFSGVEVCRNAGKSEEATLRIVEGDADEATLSSGNLLFIFNFRLSASTGNGLVGERGVDSRAKGVSRQTGTETLRSRDPGTHMHAYEPESCQEQPHRSNPGSLAHAGSFHVNRGTFPVLGTQSLTA